ncbi:MAG: glycoside hydrolase family 97 catalytic domain-containing protein [Bacteroidales bacterium]|nr:glycoside hydrolase family 97 catalytic domain-containing protein [Bacteroidales bacterium]
MKKIALILSVVLLGLPMVAKEERVAGPDGRLQVTVSDAGGKPTYGVTYDGVTFVAPSPLGLKADIGDFTDGLVLKGFTQETVADDYNVPTIKKSTVHYRANRGIFAFEKDGKPVLDVIFQVSANDIAFRYRIHAPKPDTKVCVIEEEATGYVFPKGTTSFLSPMMPPMAGFARTTPSYETDYQADQPLGRNGDGFGYVFPALFRNGDKGWVLLSETGVNGNYCGGRLIGNADGSYRLAFPMPEEIGGNGTSTVGLAIPGCTPWRTLTVAPDLKPVVETTVAWDVVEPQYEPSQVYEPSRGSWSWILKMDSNTTYPVQLQYIDFSAAMGWETILVDALWDTQIGRENMEKLAAYAKEKGVRLFVWYNSNGYWNDAPQGPRNIMNRSVTRRAEMAWLQKLGVKGIKVDFFGSDKQVMLQLYEDILVDANDFGLQCVFHGCTLPRGWERMYPNFASAEAVVASENLYFGQYRCDHEAFSATLHPFIRNTVAAMDFGGSTLNKVYNPFNDAARHGSIRRTSDVFALATAVLFQSYVQHFAMTPENLSDAPAWAVDFMKAVPTKWDEVRFIDGYPGQYVVLARRAGNKWYYAGINASAESRTVTVNLPAGDYTLYSDSVEPATAKAARKLHGRKVPLTLEPRETTAATFLGARTARAHKGGTVTIDIPCNGGFVIVQ